MNRSIFPLTLLLFGCRGTSAQQPPLPPEPGERHLRNIRQLTFGGNNAEAYFSPDGRRLIFQRQEQVDAGCDQEYTMKVDGSDLRRVSNGEGRTTCGYWYEGGRRILYSSTFEHGRACPPPPDRSGGYVWPLYDYDLYTCAADGSDLRGLASSPGYDAEGTIAPDGRIVFTSMRDGDLDLYVMDADGGNARRLTDRPGYDGGPFFSWDGRDIVWRGWHPTDPGELAEYRALLGRGLVRPSRAELFVMAADGTGAHQITANGTANWAPFLHPDGERIIFSSNLHDPGRFDFALYVIRRSRPRPSRRMTFTESFAAFPMFSPDGRRLVFCSSRGAAQPREFNVFVADWVD